MTEFARKVRYTLGVLALLAWAGMPQVAGAASIACDINDASANGEIADECAGDDSIGADPASEKGFVNSQFQDGGDPFQSVARWDADENAADNDGMDLSGFLLTVTEGDEEDAYLFSYILTVPAEFVGTVVDWVLVIKQANNSTIAYLFEDVTLGIDGGFNNFWLNPQGREVNDYSHATGFIRGDEPQLPEPTTLALLGLGLLGLGAVRRRRA